MSKKKTSNQEKGLETIESTLTKSEQFIEKNQNIIMYILIGIIAVVGIYWAFQKFYKQPRETDANSQMFVAQRDFEADSFALALNGTMNFPGFLGIIEDYSGTKASNLAHYYAGACYLKLGEYGKAIKYLKKFRTSDIILGSIRFGMMGDACIEEALVQETNQVAGATATFDLAIDYYKRASQEKYYNDFSSPIYLKKLGLTYEHINDYKNALKAYQKIYDNFSKSNEARTIEKYIERAKLQNENSKK